MDIICAGCGRHFDSIEAAREHSGRCKKTPEGESISWRPASKSKITPEEWEALMKHLNTSPASTDNELNLTGITCPNCGNNLFHDFKLSVWKCKECKRIYTYDDLQKKRKKTAEQEKEAIESKQLDKSSSDSTGNIGTNNIKITSHYRTPRWLIALLFVFALSICGLGISFFVGNSILFWILFGFSIIYSIEKWFNYITRKFKWIGKLYRLLLNFTILALLGLLIWSGIKLFSHQFVQSSLFGSLVFLAEFIFFIWMWKIVSRNSWRWPSMKLTIFSLIALFLVLAFAGVSPLNKYKDNFLDIFSSSISTKNLETTTPIPSSQATTVKPPNQTATSTLVSSITPTTKVIGIDKKTGIYNNFYLGLVKESEGVIHGNECYGEFIVLINNKNAKNPTYSELLAFLKSDKTDEFPYQYKFSVGEFYYGQAEDKIDVNRVRDIIDGVVQPDSPKICADFAERLHNNAEKAGIRCGYVSLDMVGYSDPYNLGIKSDAGHACNVFETTDKGLIYIDCTGNIGSYGPDNNDMIVEVIVGKQYNPQYLFPSGGWYVPSGVMGIVTNIFTTWDGKWR